MPFSTLLLPVSLSRRLTVARAVSANVHPPLAPLPLPPPLSRSLHPAPASAITTVPLRIGLLSFDFNAHPTCHLAVSLLDAIQTLRRGEASRHSRRGPTGAHSVELIVYSYGKADGSEYRARIEQVLQ